MNDWASEVRTNINDLSKHCMTYGAHIRNKDDVTRDGFSCSTDSIGSSDVPDDSDSWICTVEDLFNFSSFYFLFVSFSLLLFIYFSENYERFLNESGADISFPMPQFATCLGFFIVYFIEEFCMKNLHFTEYYGKVVVECF
uniref:Ovule protein n=1 Tax=Heterorhabditis bacteriophora TaxID=37862 RepID=A0A1I7WPQ5_HETBA